jgi:hypothetical protein
VLGADDEVRVERTRRGGVGTRAAELVQESLGERQGGIGFDRLLAVTDAGECGQRARRERGHRARLVDRRRPQAASHGAPGRDSGSQRVHGIGSPREAAQDLDDGRGQRSARKLRVGLPLARPQQLGDLAVRAVGD